MIGDKIFPIDGVTTSYDSSSSVSPINEDAQSIQAGYAGLMLDDDPVGDSYFNVLDENKNLGYSPTTEGMNNALHQEEQDRMVDMLPSILTDDNVDEEYKGRALEAAVSMDRKENDLSYQYGRDLTELPSTSPDSPVDAPELKRNTMDILGNINDFRQAQQAILDQHDMSKDMTTTSNIMDFVKMLVPFMDQATTSKITSKFYDGDPIEVAKTFVLLGESKKGLIDAFGKVPVEQRIPMLKQFAEIVENANTSGFMTNKMNAKALLQSVVYGGEYSNTERFMDDVSSLLDASIIGKPIKWLYDLGKTTRAAAKAKRVVNTAKPVSPIRVAQETNPEVAGEHIADIIDDVTGEKAKALTGVERNDAILSETLPQVATEGEGIDRKTGTALGQWDKRKLSNPDLQEMVDESSYGALTAKEVVAQEAAVVSRLKNVTGLSSRSEMYSVRHVNGGVNIKGVYGPDEGGWTNADTALDHVAASLRMEGVPREDLHVLKRGDNGQFHPLMEGESRDSGEFLVGIDHYRETSYSDIMNDWERFSVKRNFLDRVPTFSKFKVARHFMDPASMLDPHLVTMANAGVDRASRVTSLLREGAKEFTNRMFALPKEAQQNVLEYIKDANLRGIDFNEAMLKNEWGFSESEIDTVRKFRDYWDDAWVLNNRVAAGDLSQKGYHIYEDAATDTRLFGKPLERQKVSSRKSMYDPETDSYIKMSDEEIDQLYSEGGIVMRSRRALSDGDSATDLIKVSKDKSTRRMTRDDIVYPYRKGYYRVSYKHPHFVVKHVKVGDDSYYRAVATAENRRDADRYQEMLQKQDPKSEYIVRGDVKDPVERQGFDMDTYEITGKTNQRTRGKRLTDATAFWNNAEPNNVKGPVDAMVSVMRSLGDKVSMTDYLNAAKQRFMSEYGDLLPTRNGQTMYPASLSDIGKGTATFSKEVADARTTYEYLSYLEHGSVNAMDSAYKGVLRAFADAAGVRGHVHTEKALRTLEKLPPIQTIKSAAFHLYIGLNPLRQVAINSHQSLLLAAKFPEYSASARGLSSDLAAFTDMAAFKGTGLKAIAKLSKRSEAELKLMYKEFEKSGLADSIDVHNMVRDTLLDFSESTKLSGNAATRVAKGTYETVRKIGFDSGEWVNVATSWLAHYDEASKSGKILNATDFKKIAGEARNFTFNMNRAGDMPYNQNALSMLFQFFQVPHKAFLSMTTNRVLSHSDRARLFGFNALMYSLPPSVMYSLFKDVLPDEREHPELHKAVVQGLEFYAFNKALTYTSGDDVSIDWSSLAPADAYGVYEFLHGVLTTDLGETISNTPSGQLFFGNNAKLTRLAKTAASLVNPYDDYKDDIEMGDLWNDMKNLSSGYSNYTKAKLALKYHKLYNSRNAVIDPKVSTPEAIALMFGFQTMDAARSYASQKNIWEEKGQAVKDADKWYKEYTKRLTLREVTPEDMNYNVKVMSQAMHVFKDSTSAMNRIRTNLLKDASRGKGGLYDAAIKLSGEIPPRDLYSTFQALPEYDKDRKEKLMSILDTKTERDNK